jgi:hypothetical protein
MKQYRNLLCFWIDPGQIRTFVQITALARPGKIIHGIGTTVLASDDVLNVKTNAGGKKLRQAAILAATAGAIPDPLSQSVCHYPAFVLANKVLAFA